MKFNVTGRQDMRNILKTASSVFMKVGNSDLVLWKVKFAEIKSNRFTETEICNLEYSLVNPGPSLIPDIPCQIANRVEAN